jgi:hypothetical protein
MRWMDSVKVIVKSKRVNIEDDRMCIQDHGGGWPILKLGISEGVAVLYLQVVIILIFFWRWSCSEKNIHYVFSYNFRF